MGTFAVETVVSEVDSRLGNIKARVDRALKEVEASDQLVELLATTELINRYAASELLSGNPPAGAGQTPKGGAPSRILSDDVVSRLKKWVAQIREIVLKIAQALHATSWTVSVGFPWAFGLSLSFDIPKP
jgi:hypothetical protein